MCVKAEGFVKRFVRELKESSESEEAEIKTSLSDRIVKTALKVCERRMKDLNEMIDDPKAFESLVSEAEWKILGADELNEERLKNVKYEKWLTT